MASGGGKGPGLGCTRLSRVTATTRLAHPAVVDIIDVVGHCPELKGLDREGSGGASGTSALVRFGPEPNRNPPCRSRPSLPPGAQITHPPMLQSTLSHSLYHFFPFFSRHHTTLCHYIALHYITLHCYHKPTSSPYYCYCYPTYQVFIVYLGGMPHDCRLPTA